MNKSKILFSLLIFLGTFYQVYTQGFFKKFKDSTDNALDLSYFLKDLNGVLPIISPITEPAIGYGAAIAGLYFIPKENDNKGYQKPDIVGIGGGYTSNGTWLVGGGYVGFWKKDKIRYRGVLGYGDINLKYYRSLKFFPKEISAEFGIKSTFILQQVNFRLGESDFFIGGNYTFSKTNVQFPKILDFPEIDPLIMDFTNSGVSVIGEFENYKNVFSPNNGMRIHLGYLQNFEFLGSDRDWGKVTFSSIFYFPVNHFWVPAIRVESLLATGDAPFYTKPFVSLRGVPAMRYQGDLTILAETEQLFNINSSRWDLVAFGGVGTAFRSIEKMEAGDLAWNAGGGFRYLIAKIFGLKMGLDIARGPEDWAVYVVFGSSWLR